MAFDWSPYLQNLPTGEWINGDYVLNAGDPNVQGIPESFYWNYDPGTTYEEETMLGMPSRSFSTSLNAPPSGMSWTDPIDRILKDYGGIAGIDLISKLNRQGYFNQFSDFDAAAQARLGPWLAARQSEVADRSDALGINSFSLDDLWALSVLTAPFTIGSGMAAGETAGAAGATSTGAAAGETAGLGAITTGVGAGATAGSTGAALGASEAGALGAGLAAEGAGVYGGLDSTAIAGTDYGLGTAGGAAGGLGGLSPSPIPSSTPSTTSPFPTGSNELGMTTGALGATTAASLSDSSSDSPTISDSGGGSGGSSGGSGLAPFTTGTALSRILDGTASTADWLSILGIAGATGLGIYGSQQQADALRDIAAQARADRAPFLAKSNEYLANPQSYLEGPGKASMDAVLRGLSVKGNPAGMPSSLALAGDYGLRSWLDATTGFGNLGLAGEDSRNRLLSGAVGAEKGIYDSLGYGLGQVTNPRPSLTDLMRSLA